MKSLRKKRRIQLIMLSFVTLTISTLLIGYAMRDGINYFRSPTQVIDEPPNAREIFRLGGLVQEGSLRRDKNGIIMFRVTDGNASLEVQYKGFHPDLFAENQGMIGKGSMEEGIFLATEILAKHDETYMPREVMDALKKQGLYQENFN